MKRILKSFGEQSVFVQCEVYGNFVEDRDCYFSKEEIMNCIEEYNIPEVPNSKYEYGLGLMLLVKEKMRVYSYLLCIMVVE